jgi:hypothetical protein
MTESLLLADPLAAELTYLHSQTEQVGLEVTV